MIAALTNHLWQSTVFGVAAAMLTLALRHNPAGVRYWLYLAASVKFLVPFAPLVAFGAHFGWRTTNVHAAASLAMEPMAPVFAPVISASVASPVTSNPFSFMPVLLLALWFSGCAAILTVWLLRWRRVSAIIRAAELLFEGREVETLRRLQSPIPIVSSNAPLEPGVFGIWRPVLFWPARMSQRLDDSQLEAILAHEAAHVRRRDNLTAAVHMLVEAIFWFHPLVWWIRARLVEERENACDQAVLSMQTEPRAYAEGILKVCEHCLEAPLACVSGVSGADLKKRMQAIVSHRTVRNLGLPQRLLLTIAALCAIAAPVWIGMLKSQTAAAPLPQFEVASVKPAAPDQRGQLIRPGANGGLTINNMPLKELITLAWRIQPFQVSGGPSWIESARFDIMAKPDHTPKLDERWLMLQSLLADRFQLKIHHETKELPVYALVLAKAGRLGTQLTESKEGTCTPFDPSKPPPPPDPGKPPVMGCGGIMMGPRGLTVSSAPIAQVIPLLSRILQRTVIDQTGLKGNFDIKLEWTPDTSQLPPPPDSAPPIPLGDSNGPSIFTALQEQLGLKLESQKGPVDILVIDHVEKPSEN